MKDFCLELASKQTGFNTKLNIMREYLQAYALRTLQDDGAFRSMAFVGGTALRFLHALPRFSEDLDFSLEGKKNTRPFSVIIKKIKEEFILAGYDVTVIYNDEKTVQHAFLKFEGLMHEAGISPHKDQRLSIKIKIDTRPPEGAILETKIVNKYFPLSFLSYDLSSLFAGKFHALLSRKYTKGRDFFDLGWYLSRWKDLSPNTALLKNALKQSGWKREFPTQDNWSQYVSQVVKKVDWKKIKQDVQNFLENPSDLAAFSQENVLRLVSLAGTRAKE